MIDTMYSTSHTPSATPFAEGIVSTRGACCYETSELGLGTRTHAIENDADHSAVCDDFHRP